VIPITRKAQKGQPFAPSASVHNALIDAANEFMQTRDRFSAGEPNVWGLPSILLRVRNDSGGDLLAGSILRMGSALAEFPSLPREVSRRPVVAGDVAQSPLDPVAVLLEPLAEDAVGRAVAMGFVTCTVQIIDVAHQYALPIAGDISKLRSCSIGAIRIISRASTGTGDKVCLVLIQGWTIGEVQALVKCTSNTVTSGLQPGVIREKDGVGGRVDGEEVRIKATSGDKFRIANGGEYRLFLAGTATVGDDDFLLFDGPSSTAWVFPVCRAGNDEWDRAWIPTPLEVQEDVPEDIAPDEEP
jgi:hypothetical protein